MLTLLRVSETMFSLIFCRSFMHKYQIAVKSSMDSYVRSATSETETKIEAVKRKWEDTGGSDLGQLPQTSPVQEKKAKK